jgi:hypothetical protein
MNHLTPIPEESFDQLPKEDSQKIVGEKTSVKKPDRSLDDVVGDSSNNGDSENLPNDESKLSKAKISEWLENYFSKNPRNDGGVALVIDAYDKGYRFSLKPVATNHHDQRPANDGITTRPSLPGSWRDDSSSLFPPPSKPQSSTTRFQHLANKMSSTRNKPMAAPIITEELLQIIQNLSYTQDMWKLDQAQKDHANKRKRESIEEDQDFSHGINIQQGANQYYPEILDILGRKVVPNLRGESEVKPLGHQATSVPPSNLEVPYQLVQGDALEEAFKVTLFVMVGEKALTPESEGGIKADIQRLCLIHGKEWMARIIAEVYEERHTKHLIALTKTLAPATSEFGPVSEDEAAEEKIAGKVKGTYNVFAKPAAEDTQDVVWEDFLDSKVLEQWEEEEDS